MPIKSIVLTWPSLFTVNFPRPITTDVEILIPIKQLNYSIRMVNGPCFLCLVFLFYLKDRIVRLQRVQDLPRTWKNHDQSRRKGKPLNFNVCIPNYINFYFSTIFYINAHLYVLHKFYSSFFYCRVDFYFPQFKMRAGSLNEEKPP